MNYLSEQNLLSEANYLGAAFLNDGDDDLTGLDTGTGSFDNYNQAPIEPETQPVKNKGAFWSSLANIVGSGKTIYEDVTGKGAKPKTGIFANPAKTNKTLLYSGIGAGALLLIYVMTKKK